VIVRTALGKHLLYSSPTDFGVFADIKALKYFSRARLVMPGDGH